MSDLGPELRIVPANEAGCDDLAAVFGACGAATRCWCQRSKLHPGESFGGFAAGVAAGRMREQTRCGEPDADATSGLVAYLGDEPVGWCGVEPRAAYHGLLRKTFRIHWEGRDEDRHDETVGELLRGRATASTASPGPRGAAVERGRDRGPGGGGLPDPRGERPRLRSSMWAPSRSSPTPA